ncbi:DUF1796 family putative cysteine peptidase [Alteromonas sp. OM2203]|uniref:DUF1796 family putative cysteine peptidase n=1 Tax=Alteromonas sp. OM2203 TaxID=3398817 RepID=UPI003AF33348
MKWISLGSTCQPAYWIRNELKQPEAYFFDWLITPPKALIKVLDDGIDDLLDVKNLSIHHRGIRVIDDLSGLEFQHDFPEDETGKILDSYVDYVDNVRDKYIRRYERLIELIASDKQIVFVRYGDRPSNIPSLREKIQETLMNSKSILIFASEHIECDQEDFPFFYFNLEPCSDWKGDQPKWKEIVDKITRLESETK